MLFHEKFLDELQNTELKKLVNFIKTFTGFNEDTNKQLSEFEKNSNKQLNHVQKNTDIRHLVKRHKYWRKLILKW